LTPIIDFPIGKKEVAKVAFILPYRITEGSAV